MAKKTKVAKEAAAVSAEKRPKDGGSSFFREKPIWSFSHLDCRYSKWGFHHTDALFEEVITKLRDYERMSCSDIMSASGGRNHGTNSHFENVSELIPEAQKRWADLHLEEYDQVFSLRLTGTRRLYGILLDGVFRVVWYDQNHEIYSLTK